jgi:hypothetical protein
MRGGVGTLGGSNAMGLYQERVGKLRCNKYAWTPIAWTNNKCQWNMHFAQGVSDHKWCAFDIDPFIFRFVFETFAIEANNSNNHYRAIFGNQSRGHELEQHFELELLFLVWEVRTREGCQGASGHGHSNLFESRDTLFRFLKRFPHHNFSQKCCRAEPQMTYKIKENL